MRSAILFLAFTILTACSSRPIDLGDGWQLVGKISVRAGDETQVASINWRESGGIGDIRLAGPAGMGAVEVQIDDRQVQITTAEGIRTIAVDAPLEVDGTSLIFPWRAMSQWVRGRSSTGKPLPPGGTIENGWEIAILKMDAKGPRLMSFRHPSAQLRLSVSRWTISGSTDGADSI